MKDPIIIQIYAMFFKLWRGKKLLSTFSLVSMFKRFGEAANDFFKGMN
jgi:hypothetical protein